MARLLKRKDFARWQAGERLSDAALCDAVQEMENGLFDADLGGLLYKKRLARPGGGKSGGYRTLLSARIGSRYVFLHGFAKSEQANITQDEKKALQFAGVKPDDVDMLVVCTVTGDTPTPSCASFVQAQLGASNAFAFDVGAACAGSLYGLSIADQFIRSGKVKRALVIGAETLSRFVDWTNRETCVLFGDAAGAILLGASEENGRGVLAANLRTDGSMTGILGIYGGGSRRPPSAEML